MQVKAVKGCVCVCVCEREREKERERESERERKAIISEIDSTKIRNIDFVILTRRMKLPIVS